MNENDAIIRDLEKLVEELRGHVVRLREKAGTALISRDKWRNIARCPNCKPHINQYCINHMRPPE